MLDRCYLSLFAVLVCRPSFELEQLPGRQLEILRRIVVRLSDRRRVQAQHISFL